MALAFEVLSTAGAARRGRLQTPHGAVDTPAFLPVGSLGAVKGLAPDELAAQGATILLANLYHLALRPGVETISALGGLHSFSGWSRPLLTDSGGYQVFSLAPLRKVDDEGVTFRSHLDGALMRLTPRQVVADQAALGVDIGVVLDECPPWPVPEPEAALSAERTAAWARASREAWEGSPPGLFGIVQGGTLRHLRERSAEQVVELGFNGYAIGGVSVGEPGELRRTVVEWTAPLLPADKPRYLMGVGYPADILHAARNGIDLFDCVLPTRNARHGVLFTRGGLLRIKNARFRRDPLPADPACPCPACRQVSRAFLHHLFRAGEVTGPVLATVHNLRYYLDFLREIREAIESGSLVDEAVRPVTGSAG